MRKASEHSCGVIRSRLAFGGILGADYLDSKTVLTVCSTIPQVGLLE